MFKDNSCNVWVAKCCRALQRLVSFFASEVMLSFFLNILKSSDPIVRTAHGAIFIKQNLRYVLTYDLTCNPNPTLPLFITKGKITLIYYIYFVLVFYLFYKFSNFSCMFLNPNNFFLFELWLFQFIWCEKPSGTSWKRILLPKIVLTFYCLDKLFLQSQKFCKVSAFSLEFQKFFLITRTFFSHSRSEQFW